MTRAARLRELGFPFHRNPQRKKIQLAPDFAFERRDSEPGCHSAFRSNERADMHRSYGARQKETARLQ